MEAPDNVRVEFESAAKIILQWDLSTAGQEMICKNYEMYPYLQAVDVIQRWMESPVRSDDKRREAENAIFVAMARLKHEFEFILMGHTSPRYSTYSSSSSDSFSYVLLSDDYSDYDVSSEEAICDLRSIAERMNSAGYLPQCIQMYKSVRKSLVDMHFRGLRVEKLSTGDIRWSEWVVLETKIKRWIRAAKVCVGVVFADEKRLCDRVFEGLTTADVCFMEVVKDPATQLLNFAEAVSTVRPSPERLFKILDLHKALSDLMPTLDVLFPSNQSDSIRVQAAGILTRLTNLVRGVFSEFEDALLHVLPSIPDMGETIHTLTKNVTKYIILIFKYEHTLTELIVAKPTTDSYDLKILHMEFMELERTPLALHLIWIIAILQFQLEMQSKHFQDGALAHLFMMNNVYYIVQQIIGCPNMRNAIGDDCLKELTGQFEEATAGYITTTWTRVWYCLRDDGLVLSRSGWKWRFKSFNTMFEELRKTQATWLVPDPKLRKDLLTSTAVELMAAYRSFLDRFRSQIKRGRNPENYIKYSVEDLETIVLDFFRGSLTSQGSRTRSTWKSALGLSSKI